MIAAIMMCMFVWFISIVYCWPYGEEKGNSNDDNHFALAKDEIALIIMWMMMMTMMIMIMIIMKIMMTIMMQKKKATTITLERDNDLILLSQFSWKKSKKWTKISLSYESEAIQNKESQIQSMVKYNINMPSPCIRKTSSISNMRIRPFNNGQIMA